MPALTSVAAVAALASLAIAGPVEKRGSFSIAQSHRKNTTRTGAGALQKALLKFGVPVPENVVRAAQVQGQVTTTPEEFDSEYLTPITVGTVTLNLDIDTGSSDLWVFSNELPANERAGHSFYTVSAAKKQAGESWDITFGDGSSARGDVYTDTVSVGGVTATSQTVQAAQSVSASFVEDTDVDGLMGLAFSTINTVRPRQATTFFDTVKSELNSPVFAADLKFHAAGVYDFGFIDTTKFTGPLDFSPVDSSGGFWSFSASGFAVGNTQTTGTVTGIADTGTTLLLLPNNIVNAYYAQVAGATNSAAEGGIIFPCSATLPNFSLIVNGNLHTVPGEFINFAPVSNTECFGGIQSDAGIGFAIFGDIFLKSQYVVFDETQATPRIGLANQ